MIGMLWPRGKVLLYTLAAWIAASRVLIGEHYVTDVVLGAILGTVFPYYVRDRFAARRWLFEPAPGGGYRLRGLEDPALARLAEHAAQDVPEDFAAGRAEEICAGRGGERLYSAEGGAVGALPVKPFTSLPNLL